MMVAYGITVEAPAAFYAMFLVYLLSFVLIPGSLGAIAAILVANFFPRRQKAGSGGLGRGRAGRGGDCRASGSGGRPATRSRATGSAALLDRLAFSQHPLWPSRWMSAGLLASAKGDWSRAGYLPDGPLRPRGPGLPGRGGRRPRPLPPRLQPGPGGRIVAPARRAGTGSTRSSTALFFFLPRPDPAADPQGPADLPPRPGAVVAVPDLLRPAGASTSSTSAA